MSLPKYGMLDGKKVKLTDEFIRDTPAYVLERVTIEFEGGTIRPFRGCSETAAQQTGKLATAP